MATTEPPEPDDDELPRLAGNCIRQLVVGLCRVDVSRQAVKNHKKSPAGGGWAFCASKPANQNSMSAVTVSILALWVKSYALESITESHCTFRSMFFRKSQRTPTKRVLSFCVAV